MPGPAPMGDEQLAEGLRERKKRMMRQLLSDTATMLFLERGFDGFKVTDVADACGVSEKTVYNYFPTKEALILDNEEVMAESIRHALGPKSEAKSPVDAIVGVLVEERRQLREGLADLGGDDAGLALFRRFMTQLQSTPSLRAAYSEMMERLSRIAAESLAARAGVSPDDPEPSIAAHSLMGLSDVQQRALMRDAEDDRSAEDVYARADAEVRRAAQLIDTGLWSFAATASGRESREQLRAAAETMQQAGRQVSAALRQARKVWTDAQAKHVEEGGDPRDEWSTLHSLWHEHGDEWREIQREQIQRWRETQREQARAFREQQRESKRRMKDELRDAVRTIKDDAKREAIRKVAEEAKRAAERG